MIKNAVLIAVAITLVYACGSDEIKVKDGKVSLSDAAKRNVPLGTIYR